MCLREDIGRDNFDITDHWEGDRQAIGITQKGNEGVLAYISVGDKEPIYYIALELPSETDEYESVGEFNDLKYADLVQIIKKHLGLGNLKMHNKVSQNRSTSCYRTRASARLCLRR